MVLGDVSSEHSPEKKETRGRMGELLPSAPLFTFCIWLSPLARKRLPPAPCSREPLPSVQRAAVGQQPSSVPSKGERHSLWVLLLSRVLSFCRRLHFSPENSEKDSVYLVYPP